MTEPWMPQLARNPVPGASAKQEAIAECGFALELVKIASRRGANTRRPLHDIAVAVLILAHADGNDLTPMIAEAMAACTGGLHR